MVTQLRGGGAALGQALAQLGQGLADVVAPDREMKRQIELALFQNPELARQLQRAQSQAEVEAFRGVQVGQAEGGEEEAEGLPAGEQVEAEGERVVAPPTEPPNVLQQFGFSPDETRRALSVAPPLTPVERAQREEARFNLEFFRQLREEGVPAEEAIARAREAATRQEVAEAEELQAERQQTILNNLDNRLEARLRNLQARTDFELTEERLEVAQDLDAIMQDQPEFMQLAFAGQGGRSALSAIMDMERIGLRNRLARLDAARSQQDRRLELLKTRVEFRNELRDRMGEIQDLMKNQPEGWEQMLRARMSEFNETASLVAQADPRATTFVAKTTEEMFGGLGIKFEPAPGFLQTVQNQPELLQAGTKALAKARQQEVPDEFNSADQFVDSYTSMFMTKPGAQQLLKNLPGQARARYITDLQDNLRRAYRDDILGGEEATGEAGGRTILGGAADVLEAGGVQTVPTILRAGDAGIRAVEIMSEELSGWLSTMKAGTQQFLEQARERAGGQGGQ